MIVYSKNGRISIDERLQVSGKLLGIAYKSGKSGEMREIRSATVSVAAGIPDDHRGKAGKRQITVLSKEGWEAACRVTGEPLPWMNRRANLYITGIDLQNSVGMRINIGSLILEITGETKPCERMDQARMGLQEALRPDWRGGVCCRVEQAGMIRAGDKVSLINRKNDI